MKKKPVKEKRNLNIFLTYNLVTVIIGSAFGPLIPILLNYPPGSINTSFDIQHSGGIPYWMQYIVIITLIFTLLYIFFKIAFRGADKWKHIEHTLESNDINRIIKIRKKSFNMPHIVYMLQTFLPLIFIGILFIILGFNNQADQIFYDFCHDFIFCSGDLLFIFEKVFPECIKTYFHRGYSPGRHPDWVAVKNIFANIPLIFTLHLNYGFCRTIRYRERKRGCGF